MTGTEVTALVVAVAATLALVGLLVVLVWLLRTVRALTAVVQRLQREADATVADMRHVVEGARTDLDRSEGLLDAAERVAAAAESTSRVTNQALATPVIKAMAVAHGTSRAARRLRRQG
jgi:hypothetical protein